MVKLSKRLLTCTATIGLLFGSAKSLAVNGTFDYGFSEITRGMAGAGSALPQDSIITAIDPAGLVRLKKQLDVGGTLYLPDEGYNADNVSAPTPPIGSIIVAPGKGINRLSLLALPDIGINIPIDDRSAFGVALYSLAGVGVKFDSDSNAIVSGNSLPGPFGDNQLKSDLKEAVTSITYAHKFLNNSSWGVSLLLGVQTLESTGGKNLAALTKYPNNIAGKGTDYSFGIGAKFGVLLALRKNLDLNVSYQPKMHMSKFDKYKGLYPNAGELDTPAFATIGVAWHVKPSFVLVGDLVRIWYKDIPAYGTSHDALVNGTCQMGDTDKCMGGKNGAGFGWDNALIYKVGAQWSITPKTTIRAGYNHSNQILNSNYATENMITIGALVRDIVTIGLSQKIDKKDIINGMLVYIPHQSLRSLNEFSGSSRQYVTTSLSGVGFGISWSRIL